MSPVTQENLIHVNFKNLIFAQEMLKLKCQQNLVNFARVGFLCRQIHVARHLHGNGRCTLRLMSPHIGQASADHA